MQNNVRNFLRNDKQERQQKMFIIEKHKVKCLCLTELLL